MPTRLPKPHQATPLETNQVLQRSLEPKFDFPPSVQTRRPDRRLDLGDDGAVLFAMTNTFMTGMTLRVDGGEPLV